MDAILWQLSSLSHWKIDSLVVAILLQGAVIAIFPEEVVITALGVLVSLHRVSFIEAMLSVQIGLLPANASLFWLGRKFGRALLYLKPIRYLVGRAALARARLAFRSRGDWIVAGTRFTPLVRGPVYLAAGLSNMPFRRFLTMDAGASLFQIPLLLTVGAALGRECGNLLGAYRIIGTAMIGLILAGALGLQLRSRPGARWTRLRNSAKLASHAVRCDRPRHEFRPL